MATVALAAQAAEQAELDLVGGFHVGPLFEIKKRKPGRPQMRGQVRRDSLKHRTPPWANRDDMNALRTYRAMLQVVTGQAYDIDHIVPLHHPLVCGLHWAGNMQVLPKAINQAKSNNWWPDMPGQQEPLFK